MIAFHLDPRYALLPLPPMNALRSIFVGLAVWGAVVAKAGPGKDCGQKAAVRVECATTSAFLNIDIAHCRKIGHVVIEVKNKEGLVLYKEEGKALAEQLVRRLDKGVFPKGELSLSVTTRDFAITQPFSIR